MKNSVLVNLIGVFVIVSALFISIGISESKKTKEYSLLKKDLENIQVKMDMRCDLYSEYRVTRYECYLLDNKGEVFLSMLTWSSIVNMKKNESSEPLAKLSFYEFKDFRINFEVIKSLKCVLNPFNTRSKDFIESRTFSLDYHCLKNSDDLIKIIERNKF